METPQNPEQLFNASHLTYDFPRYEEGVRRTEQIFAGREVFVTGVDGTPLGVGKFLGFASMNFLGEPDFMPVLEVQGHRFYGFECWWTIDIDEEMESIPAIPVGDYLAEREAGCAVADAEDAIAQEEMGIDFS